MKDENRIWFKWSDVFETGLIHRKYRINIKIRRKSINSPQFVYQIPSNLIRDFSIQTESVYIYVSTMTFLIGNVLVARCRISCTSNTCFSFANSCVYLFVVLFVLISFGIYLVFSRISKMNLIHVSETRMFIWSSIALVICEYQVNPINHYTFFFVRFAFECFEAFQATSKSTPYAVIAKISLFFCCYCDTNFKNKSTHLLFYK